MPHLRTQKGISWNYELDGQGEVIVFLHGWGGNLRLWSGQVGYFSGNYKVMRMDLPGHGQTSWKKMSLSMMARDLEEGAEILGFQQINVVGSSLGGLIAIQWFDLFPKRFKRMALVGALPKFLHSADYPYGLELEQLKKLDGQLETDYPAIVNIFFRSLFTRQERQTSRFKYFARFEKNEAVPRKEALREFLNVLEKEDLRKTFDKFNQHSIPLQILSGAEDPICSKEAVSYLQRELPPARVKFFKDCGHFPFLTKPLEFNEALGYFLNDSKIN